MTLTLLPSFRVLALPLSRPATVCVVFLLQGNVTEKSSSLHVHVFCICATDLSFLAECLAIPNEVVAWFSPSLQPFYRSRVYSYSRIYRPWL